MTATDVITIILVVAALVRLVTYVEKETRRDDDS